jgi:hypothetical protein
VSLSEPTTTLSSAGGPQPANAASSNAIAILTTFFSLSRSAHGIDFRDGYEKERLEDLQPWTQVPREPLPVLLEEEERVMRMLLVLGVILLLLGLASLVVPVPRRERHGIDAGGISLGIETTSREKVHPAVSAVLIAGGVVLILGGRRRR